MNRLSLLKHIYNSGKADELEMALISSNLSIDEIEELATRENDVYDEARDLELSTDE